MEYIFDLDKNNIKGDDVYEKNNYAGYIGYDYVQL